MTLNDWLVLVVCGSLIFAGGFTAGYAWTQEAIRRAERDRFERYVRHRDSLARCMPEGRR